MNGRIFNLAILLKRLQGLDHGPLKESSHLHTSGMNNGISLTYPTVVTQIELEVLGDGSLVIGFP